MDGQARRLGAEPSAECWELAGRHQPVLALENLAGHVADGRLDTAEDAAQQRGIVAHPHSVDIGLIPPELFSHVLARSRATAIDPNDDVAHVIIDPEPTTAAATEEDSVQVGYTPPNEYKPRAKWKDKLDGWVQNPPPNVGSWQVDISLYWRWRTLQGMSLMAAWTQLRMQPDECGIVASSQLDRQGLGSPGAVQPRACAVSGDKHRSQ